MPQRHIVEGSEHRGVHVVQAADGHFLRLAAGSPRHELVGDQNVPPGRADVHGTDGKTEGIGVAPDLLFRPEPPQHGGFQEGEQVNGNLPYFVF